MKPLPWRMQTDDTGGFDELVVRSLVTKAPCLIHAEMMDERSIFVTIGPMRVWAHVGKNGRVRITMLEDVPLELLNGGKE